MTRRNIVERSGVVCQKCFMSPFVVCWVQNATKTKEHVGARLRPKSPAGRLTPPYLSKPHQALIPAKVPIKSRCPLHLQPRFYAFRSFTLPLSIYLTGSKKVHVGFAFESIAIICNPCVPSGLISCSPVLVHRESTHVFGNPFQLQRTSASLL